MRIIFLTQYYPPETGAPQARLSSLAEKMAAEGNEVIVLTGMPSYPKGKIFSGYGGILQEETMKGVRVIRTFLFPSQSPAFLPRLLNYFSFVLSSLLIGGSRLPQADYLMTESPPLFLGISGYLLSRWKKARWIFNVSDLWPESAVSLGKIRREGLGFYLSSKLEAFCYLKAWLVTGQSQGIVSNIQKRFSTVPARLLSNGVEIAKFTQVLSRPANHIFPDIQADDDECRVLYTGLHGLAQGLDQILEAARRMEKKRIHFILAGEGPEKKQLMESARRLGLKKVFFIEGRPFDKVPEMLAAADIIVITLKDEILGAVPSKLYEAMASGKPIVLVASGEAAQIVDACGCGYTVKPGDITGLVGALEALSQDKSLCSEMGSRGRKQAEKSFNKEAIHAQFIEFLKEAGAS